MNISGRSNRNIVSDVPPLGVKPPSLASQDTATTRRGPRFQAPGEETFALPKQMVYQILQMVKYPQRENVCQYTY